MNIPRSRLFWAVSLGHMTNDIFMSMGPVLLAFMSVTILPMTNTQIGLTVSAVQLMGAVSQPWFGWLADKTGGRWIGAGGVAWTVGFMMLGLVGAQTGYFWLMFIPWVLRALGSGAFHPVGSMHAANSDKDKSASNLSYFFLMGQLGLALGPVLAGVLLDNFNRSVQPLFTAPFAPVYDGPIIQSGTIAPLFLLGFLLVAPFMMMVTTIPSMLQYQAEREAEAKQTIPTEKAGSLPILAFSILGTMILIRSLANPGSVAFIPVLFQNKGWTPAEYGAITSSFWIASGVMGVVFGNLADRYDRRLVVAGSLLASAPAYFLLPIVDGPVAFLMAIAAGGLAGGSHSVIVVVAQELIPGAKGFASGMILGLIFGAGAIGTILIGTVSDVIGLEPTFQLVAGAVVIAAGLSMAIPARKPTPPPSGSLNLPDAEAEMQLTGAD